MINFHLSKSSVMWNASKNNGLKMKLNVCDTGRDFTNSKINISQQLTKAFPTITVTAPQGQYHKNGYIVGPGGVRLGYNTYRNGIKL
jgi:hypothetical protein